MTLLRMGLCLGFLFQAAQVHALMLGGANVPKEKIVVYLLIGHSNMAGVDYTHLDATATPNAWNYTWATDKTWIAAKESRTSRAGLSSRGAGGPGIPFLKLMTQAYPGYHFGVVANASVSSTCKGLNTGNNNSGFDPDDNRYWKGARLYNEILIAAKEIQPNVTLGGILCMLGSVEATRTTEEVCRSFSDDLAQLVKDLRADLGEPNLPFIMGEYEAGATRTFALTLPWPAIIDQQIKLLPSKLPFSGTVNSVGVTMLDDHHYSSDKGQPEWAKRAFALIQNNKWYPASATSFIATSQPRRLSGSAMPTLEFFPETGLRLVNGAQGFYLINGRGYAGRELPILEHGKNHASSLKP